MTAQLRFNRSGLLAGLVLSIFATLFGTAPVRADEDRQRTIAMTGSATVKAEPDMATLTAGVITIGETARQALNANSMRMTAVIGAFREAGLPDKDIQTANFQVMPRYRHERPSDGTIKPPVIEGYEVRNEVVVIVRDLERLGAILDTAVTVGANTLAGPTFGLADRAPLLDDARRKAAADATRKAMIYTEALGVTLGEIVAIRETSAAVPRPQMVRAMAMEAAAAELPIASGEVGLTVEVNVTWALN